MRDRRPTTRTTQHGIAQTAARLLVEGMASDFGTAKRKAAAQLGMHDQRQLPDNRTVQNAVVEYQRIFEARELPERIARLRADALTAMKFVVDFEPRLVGPVLYGTAFAHSPVTLHVFTDEVERLSRFLLEHRVRFRIGDKTLRIGPRESETYARYSVWMHDTEFELIAMPRVRLAHPPLCPLDGAPYRRMSAAELAALIETGRGAETLWAAATVADAPFDD